MSAVAFLAFLPYLLWAITYFMLVRTILKMYQHFFSEDFVKVWNTLSWDSSPLSLN